MHELHMITSTSWFLRTNSHDFKIAAHMRAAILPFGVDTASQVVAEIAHLSVPLRWRFLLQAHSNLYGRYGHGCTTFYGEPEL